MPICAGERTMIACLGGTRLSLPDGGGRVVSSSSRSVVCAFPCAFGLTSPTAVARVSDSLLTVSFLSGLRWCQKSMSPPPLLARSTLSVSGPSFRTSSEPFFGRPPLRYTSSTCTCEGSESRIGPSLIDALADVSSPVVVVSDGEASAGPAGGTALPAWGETQSISRTGRVEK